MEANTSKTRLDFPIKHNKSSTRKILLLILILLLVITIFSTVTSASRIKDIKTGVKETTKAKIANAISKIRDTIKDFINQRLKNTKWRPIFQLVTRYQKNGSSEIIEKVTRMKLFSPMSIDVNGDHFNDIRVWVFHRPALDLHPPALGIKNTFLIRRLLGMEKIKYDFFEIYLEYNPKIITKFFYLTQDIDRIRVGYQSPAGEEIPKTCIVTDKIIPHLIYPMKKTTHKISVNPCSIVGKSQLNLIFALADLENGMVKSEKIIQVNYTPAARTGEIIFEQEKTKLFGRGQSLEIARADSKPSNVTLFIKELTWKLTMNPVTLVKHGSITVENIPKKINLEWLIGRTGYIDINTHNDEIGRVKAVFNNTVIVGFVPENSMHGRVAWENRTLIGVLAPWGFPLKGLETFDISFSVYDSFTLKDFSLMVTNQENATNKYILKSTASSLFLDLDAGAEFGNVTAEYWLFPIYFFPLDPNTTITINFDIKNLKLKAENITFDLERTTSETNTSERNVNDSLNGNFSAKYFEVSSEDAKIFVNFNFETPEINAEAELGLDMHTKDVVFSITRTVDNNSSTANGSFSSLDFSTSNVFSLSSSETTVLSVAVNGSFELNDFSFQGKNFLAMKAFNAHGDISCEYYKDAKSTSNMSIKGEGDVIIEKLHVKYNQNNTLGCDLLKLSGEMSFYKNNILSDNSSYSKMFATGLGTLEIINLSTNSSNEILQINEFSLLLEGNYSDCQFSNSTSHLTNRRLEGNGTLAIKNYKSKNQWNYTLTCKFFNFSGEYLWFSTNISSGSFFDSRIESTRGKLEIKDITLESSYNTKDIKQFSSSSEENCSEQQLRNFTATLNDAITLSKNITASSSNTIKSTSLSTLNNYLKDNTSISSTNSNLKGNVNATLEKTYYQDRVNKILFRCDLIYISGAEYISTNLSSGTKSYIEIFNGTLTIKNLYANDTQNNILEFDLFNFSGEHSWFSTYLSSEPQYYTEILNGTLTIKNLYANDTQNNILEFDLFNFS
ncbi:MAG: hypothetical protein ACQXXD_06635, partial [Thermoplasmatota archaeon]